ncbi:MAG: hypothetical protein JWM78_2710 [Verrucomicrobiaceae bacterium]|nr:hypothetical protein [Verrucomicrobiaceae bacterium]
MVLAAAWLAQQEVSWEDSDIYRLKALCADWREHCVLPLRAVRRYLKQKPTTTEMYSHAKALELEAENYQLQFLEAELAVIPAANANADDLLERNLHLYFETLPCAHQIDAAFIASLTALIKAV